MAMFSPAVIVFLCAHTVFGFGMVDVLRAARQLEAQHLRRSLKSPVNAIIEVVQGVLDSDENGDISIAEVEAHIYRWFNPNNIQPFTLGNYDREGKGYMLTLANLIDANGDGNIGTTELHRAAEMLVNNGGNSQAGRIIELKMVYNERLPSYSPQTEATKAVDVFTEAGDFNKDGEISIDEMHSMFRLRRFRWLHDDLNASFEAADGNGDGKLNKAEAVHFLTGMGWWTLRHVLIYVEIYERVGKLIADEWARGSLM